MNALLSTTFTTPTTVQDYLFVPSNPAANGRLHLGHIAGPYLSADLMARHRQRQGHRVKMLFGIDAYNSYVVRRAEIENSDPATVATTNWNLIQQDLQAMDIAYDVFTNPLDETWSQAYEQKHHQIFEALLTQDALQICEELSPYAESTGKFQPDYAVSGTCPDCHAEMGGFSCEGCGGYFYPHSILNQVSATGEKLAFRPVLQYCLDANKSPISIEDFEHYQFSQDVLDIIQRHLEKRDGWFKLTHHFDWGLDTTVNEEPRSIASFMTEYIYNLMHADLYAALTGLSQNPYSVSSPVKIICSFGIDNVLAQAFGKNLMAKALKDYRADDGFLINYFFNLEGQKFSTSRRHVIWASEIVEQTPANSDGIRLYLSLNSPTQPDQNFDIQALLTLYNETLASQLNEALEQNFGKLEQLDQVAFNTQMQTSAPSELLEEITSLYQRQEFACQDTHIDPKQVADSVLRWIHHPKATETSVIEAYWWLKGLALLSYPVLPDLSKQIWQQLALSEIPKLSEFLSDCALRLKSVPFEPFLSLSYETLAPCLPDSIRLPVEATV